MADEQEQKGLTMEEQLQAACDARHIAGAVIMASNKSGSFNYKNAFGVRSLNKVEEPLAYDSVMWMASCTKLITTIAVMQCVDRGLVTLDEDIRTILTELKGVDIIEGDEAGKIVARRENTSPITLRQLLTHTSGIAYDSSIPVIKAWRTANGQSGPHTSYNQLYQQPLIFEPGTSWVYGPSIDWAGLVVERVTKSKSLQEYMMENIWHPLGINDMTFFLSTRPDMQAKRVGLSLRTEEQTIIYAQRQPTMDPDAQDCLGGQGIYTSAEGYMKVLQAILRATGDQASDDPIVPAEQLLRRSTANSMFEPNLNDQAQEKMSVETGVPVVNRLFAGMPISVRKNHGLGGVLVQENLDGWRRKGTLTWGGAANLSWWIDRDADLCGFFASQLIPAKDKKTNELVQAFEKAMYERRSTEGA